jgi:LuxR family transcriptional regulator, maltose regulon positive regulatory protein
MSEAATAPRLQTLHPPAIGPRLEGLASPSVAPNPERGSGSAAYVPRPRLLRRLAEARCPLALIAAPAGYGKTTLLEQWERADPRPFAWVTLDRGARHGGALVAAVEEALDRAAPVTARYRDDSARSGRSSAAVALGRLTRSLEARPPFVLVLDDLQKLGGEGAAEMLARLARAVPRGSVLALSSRTEPPLPLGRVRANRALTEIRTHDLVMTTGEAAELLERCAVTLSEADEKALAHKTEGWAAGLYLAAVAVRGQRDRSSGVEHFGGDDSIVADYLRDEVLSQLPEASVAFLTQASVLDRLSGPVCDFVLERSGSGQLLSSIGHRDLLLVPRDRAGEEFRCHALLAQMLRAELRRAQPDLERQLHRRASDWYARQADFDRAMHHAVAAGDAARAGVLLRAGAPECVSIGRNRKMEQWLAGFTRAQIAAESSLALAAANNHFLNGELDEIRAWDSAASRALDDTPAAERTAAQEASVELLHAMSVRGGLLEMGHAAARAFELEPEDSPWRALCCLLDGVSRHLTGDPEGAEALFEEGVRRGAVAAPNMQTLCLAQLALLASERDDHESAAAFAARALAQVAHYALADRPSSALVFAVSAAIRARRGRIEEAQQDAHEARRLLGMLADFIPWYEGQTSVALAYAGIRLSDYSGAREQLTAAGRVARRLPDAVLLHDEISSASEKLEAAVARPGLLTTAELRILGFLPTHLSFREIAAQLYVSANTVKTQAHAVYRKLDAASRSEAVAHAARLGLLDCSSTAR